MNPPLPSLPLPWWLLLRLPWLLLLLLRRRLPWLPWLLVLLEVLL